MAGLRALLGLYPNTKEFETKRQKLEDEFNAIAQFENSAEYKRYVKLEAYLHSEEFSLQRKELLSLRYSKSEEYKKEKEYIGLKKANDIVLYYKIKDSERLKDFLETEKSAELKRFNELEKLVNSAEFAEVKKATSQSAGKKFAASDLAITLQQFEQQKKSADITGYLKFTGHKYFQDYNSVLAEKLDKKVEELKQSVTSAEFAAKRKSMKKTEFSQSPEKKMLDDYKLLIKSKKYKRFLARSKSPHRQGYEKLKDSDQLEAFISLRDFIGSEEFKKQRREIEKKTFKDTGEYQSLREFEQLKKSARISSYFKFKDSKEWKNFQQLDGSERIKSYEKLKEFIASSEFTEKKSYLTQSPKKRLKESEIHQREMEFEQLSKSKEIRWYFKAKKDKKFDWFRHWQETFKDDFNGASLDESKWITRYFWGDELLKDSYSLSHEKHFITNGKNLDVKDSTLVITTKKEEIKGKSWHPDYGFILREFGYTSGLVNTGRSFRQKYGVFEAKIRINQSHDIQNAFWMVSKTMVPHIDVAKANGKVLLGNAWGNARDLSTVRTFSKSLGRSKLARDYFIYTLDWTAKKLIWKINGIEIARSSKGVPQEEMYLVLSSGLTKEPNNNLPAQMEVDWVRCYQHKDQLSE